MKHNPHNSLLAAVTVAGFAIAALLAAPSAHAAALTWDAVTGDGGAITAGSGAWNITAGNLVWNDGTTPNVIWSQTSTTDGSNTATFAGTDGATNAYVITLAAQMAAESLTFNSSGYHITGGTLALMPTTTTNGAITVAAGKTATINSALFYADNKAVTNQISAGATLNLGGGATNAQYTFTGGGTVNMTAGTYNANIGTISTTFNQTGGTFNITPGSNNGYNINSGTKNVNYTLSGGTLSVNGNASTATVNGSYLGIGSGTTTAFTSTLNVQTGATINVGTTASRSGGIR
jgi:hypothetical protein